ncbi:hypothetical protein K8R33_04740 [archaeon]|nr:hypothetical protein [archaeon]
MKKIMIFLISLLLISNAIAVDPDEQSMELNILDERTAKVIIEETDSIEASGNGNSNDSNHEETIGICDFDGNGIIDIDDTIYQSIVMSWFSYATPDLRADLYEDGVIDINDIIVFSQNRNIDGWCHKTFWGKLNPEEPVVENHNSPSVRKPKQVEELEVEEQLNIEELDDEIEELPQEKEAGFFKNWVNVFMSNLTIVLSFLAALI